MKKARSLVYCLALAGTLCVNAQTPATKPAPAQKPAPATKPAPSAKPAKTDAEIQKCIQDKLAAAPKLKDQGFSVTVGNGTATFTGKAKNAGSKGSVTGIAKSCGAKTITNNITVEAPAKPATPPPAVKKPADKKP